jgi:hypothetical protein
VKAAVARATGSGAAPETATEANRRLTALTAAVLFVLLAAEGVTVFRIRDLLSAHYFIGLLLVPPVLLKLGSTGYRFARYYLGDARYRRAGPPEMALRLLAPVVVVSTVVLFGSGIELWLFGFRYGIGWLTLHKLGFLVWFFAMGGHVLAHLDGTRRLAAADLTAGGDVPGAITRRSLVAASLAVGLLLAVVSLPWWSPFGLLES